MRWRIVYTDGSSFSDEDGSPAAAPGGGVVAIAQGDQEVGTLIHQGSDYYVWDRVKLGGWAGMDAIGFADYVIAATNAVVVKLGRALPTRDFIDMLEELRRVGFGKSARYPWERRI